MFGCLSADCPLHSVCVGMVKHLTGDYKVTYHPTDDEELTLDFSPPFKKVSLIAELEKILQVTFPPADTLDTEGIMHYWCVLHCFLNVCCRSKTVSVRFM